MASSGTRKQARAAARLGVDLTESAFCAYYGSLKKFLVVCPKCQRRIRANQINLHMVEKHNATDPQYHAGLHVRLRKSVHEIRKQAAQHAAQRERLARLAAKKRDREYIRSGKLYPSAWRLVMEHKGTYVREVPGGAIEMNRRRH